MSSADSSDHNENPSDEFETDTEEQQRSEIRGKLATMSFEELLKMKEKIGSKFYNKMLSGNEKTRKPLKIKRANKNRPQEVSSKIKRKIIERTIVTPKTKQKIIQHRDPRFDGLCGTFDKEKFQIDYKFVYDLQEKEQKILEKEEKEEHDFERKKKLKSAIQRLVSINKCNENNHIYYVNFQKNKSNEKKKIDENLQKKIENKLEIKKKLKRGEVPIRKNRSKISLPA